MARYKTTARTYIGDKLIEPGEEIGDGTNTPLPDDFVPNMVMEPLDKDAERRVKAAGMQRDARRGFIPLRRGRADPMTTSDVPVEDAPGVPHKPWVGPVGPEHGPDLEGVEDVPAGYDSMAGDTGVRANAPIEPKSPEPESPVEGQPVQPTSESPKPKSAPFTKPKK